MLNQLMKIPSAFKTSIESLGHEGFGELIHCFVLLGAIHCSNRLSAGTRKRKCGLFRGRIPDRLT